MKAFPATYKLKNGSVITIRHARIEDAAKLVETKRKYIAESPFIPITIEEYTQTLEQEEQLISNYINQTNSLLLIAELDGEILGNIDLTGSSRNQLAHTAMMGIGMLPAFQGMGLGTYLLKHALDWAQSNEKLEIIWLEVMPENIYAVKLYTQSGFEAVGSIPNFFKQENLQFDKLTMYKNVK
jgi:ribosomal protein S18 acetylase RimI-like enzyme